MLLVTHSHPLNPSYHVHFVSYLVLFLFFGRVYKREASRCSKQKLYLSRPIVKMSQIYYFFFIFIKSKPFDHKDVIKNGKLFLPWTVEKFTLYKIPNRHSLHWCIKHKKAFNGPRHPEKRGPYIPSQPMFLCAKYDNCCTDLT